MSVVFTPCAAPYDRAVRAQLRINACNAVVSHNSVAIRSPTVDFFGERRKAATDSGAIESR